MIAVTRRERPFCTICLWRLTLRNSTSKGTTDLPLVDSDACPELAIGSCIAHHQEAKVSTVFFSGSMPFNLESGRYCSTRMLLAESHKLYAAFAKSPERPPRGLQNSDRSRVLAVHRHPHSQGWQSSAIGNLQACAKLWPVRSSSIQNPSVCCRQLIRREAGENDASQPASSAPESDPDISELGGDSGKASDPPKTKHRLASSSRAEDDASKPSQPCSASAEGFKNDVSLHALYEVEFQVRDGNTVNDLMLNERQICIRGASMRLPRYLVHKPNGRTAASSVTQELGLLNNLAHSLFQC